MSSDFMPQALDSLLASQRASVYGSSKTGSSDNSWMEDYEILSLIHISEPTRRS